MRWSFSSKSFRVEIIADDERKRIYEREREREERAEISTDYRAILSTNTSKVSSALLLEYIQSMSERAK